MTWLEITGWVVRIGMVPIVAYRRRLLSALSWLAVIFLVPWLGVPLYVLMAERRLTTSVRRQAEIRREVRRTLAEPKRGERPPTAPSPTLDPVTELTEIAHALGGFRPVDGNAVEAVPAEDGWVEEIVGEIDRAGDRVEILFYIIQEDPVGRRIAEALERAAQRGVRCRVLADAIGSRRFHRRLAPRLRSAGVEVRRVLPLGVLLKRLRPLDLRNHRKLILIDGRVAWTGSVNLMELNDRWSGENRPWREVLLRVRGPVVRDLGLVFEEDWRLNGGPPPESRSDSDAARHTADPPAPGDVRVQVVPSGPDVPEGAVQHLLVAALNRARERVLITTPYFIPDEPTRVALRLAVYRGVQIDLVVPHRSDSRLVTAASRSYFQEFLDVGIRVHEHTAGFLHAKTLTVDRSLAMLGSANFDPRSFHLNVELNVLLYGEASVRKVLDLQLEHLERSRPLDADRWRRRPSWRRAAEDTVRLLSPLM